MGALRSLLMMWFTAVSLEDGHTGVVREDHTSKCNTSWGFYGPAMQGSAAKTLLLTLLMDLLRKKYSSNKCSTINFTKCQYTSNELYFSVKKTFWPIFDSSVLAEDAFIKTFAYFLSCTRGVSKTGKLGRFYFAHTVAQLILQVVV